MQQAKRKKTVKVLALILLPLLLAGILLKNALVYVPPGCVGMVKTFGALNGATLDNGVHFKLPFVRSVQNVDNRIRQLNVTAASASQELQALNVNVSVSYKVKAENLVAFFRDIGASEFDYNILQPAVQESVKSITAKYTVDDLVKESEQANAEIAALVESKVLRYGIDVMSFNVTELTFSDAFRTAIEEKQVAQQELLSSQARAEATVALAEAKAEANRLISDSLTPLYVEYLIAKMKTNKWDGKMPSVSGGSAIVDFRD